MLFGSIDCLSSFETHSKSSFVAFSSLNAAAALVAIIYGTRLDLTYIYTGVSSSRIAPMAISTRAAAELIIVIFSLGLFFSYHVWLFLLRGRWYKVKSTYHDFFQAGKLARSLWAEACATDEKDAILGVQQARNAMTACTYLATISVALATAGITILFDEGKIERIRQLAVHDPIMRNLEGLPLVPPTVIVALALGALYASFVCFAQSVRLYVHTGFYIRACTSRFNPGTLTVREAKKVTIHAGLAFTVGLRLFYLFIPLVMWSIGVTALLISSVLMTTLVAYMDHFDMAPDPDEQVDEESTQRLTSQHAQNDPGSAQHDGTAGSAQHVTAANSTSSQAALELATVVEGMLMPAASDNVERLQPQLQQQNQQHQQHVIYLQDSSTQTETAAIAATCSYGRAILVVEEGALSGTWEAQQQQQQQLAQAQDLQAQHVVAAAV